MSTMLADKGSHWEVSTLAAPGRRKKLPRRRVRVPKGDPDALRLEMIRQAEAARSLFLITQRKEEPVV